MFYLDVTILLIDDYQDLFSCSRFGLAHIARVGSVLATISVTIERLVAVVAPLHRMKKSTSIKIMVASFVISVIYNQPRFFEIETITTKSAGLSDNLTVSETFKSAQFIRVKIIKTKYYFEYHFNHICFSDDVCSTNSSEA